MKADRIGRVARSVGGFHTVVFDDGEARRVVARGKLKRKGAILAGDLVRVAPGGDVVEDVLERKTLLVRPGIANIDTVVIVMACQDPPPSLELLDRMLLQAEILSLAAIVVFNKVDLVSEEEAAGLATAYAKSGYSVILACAPLGKGIKELKTALPGRLSVFSGPSGVGKSSLLAAISPKVDLPTQPVSEKTKRGRHTTREVSLLPLPGGGWVADSPGFSTLQFGELDPRKLPRLYPEFARLEDGCRYSGCMHRDEPDCAVRAAACSGDIDAGRYTRYLRILDEVQYAYQHRF